MHDFNPLIFKKRSETRFVPGYLLRRALQAAGLVKLGVRERHVEGILKRDKAAGVKAAALEGVVDPSKVREPRVVPETFMIRYEII